MSDKYLCGCGARISVRGIVKNCLTVCPECGDVLPHKTIMRMYRKEATERQFRLYCLCGATYRITPPSGKFEFSCPKCGRWLLSIRPRTLNGVEIPRYIEGVAESK